MLDENNVRKGFFEHNQFSKVRDHLPEYLKGFVTIAYNKGWRLDEIECLTWEQVDRKLGIIRLEPGGGQVIGMGIEVENGDNLITVNRAGINKQAGVCINSRASVRRPLNFGI